MKLYWVGGPTVILELGAFRLLIDPVLGDSVNIDGVSSTRITPLPAADFGAADYVCVTRNRADHVDAAAGERLGAVSKLIAPKPGAGWLDEAGFTNVETHGWWTEVDATKGAESLKMTVLPTSYDDEQSQGYLFHHNDGEKVRNVYYTGDTVWFSAVREIKARYDKLDLFVPVLGAVGGEAALQTPQLQGVDAVRVSHAAEAHRPGWLQHVFSLYGGRQRLE